MPKDSTPSEKHDLLGSVLPVRPDASASPNRADDLAALSAAGDHFVSANPSWESKPRPSIVIAILTALVAGAALTLAGRFEYRCGATLQVTGVSSFLRQTQYKKELLAYAWDDRTGDEVPRSEWDRWLVEMPRSDLLRLYPLTSSRDAGTERVRTVVEGFCQKKAKDAERARLTTGEAEEVLSEFLREFADRLDRAQREFDSIADLPGEDPFEHHAELRNRWNEMRDKFTQARERMSRASTELARLRSDPELSRALIQAEDRRRAIEADNALQQDLRELVVNLSEIKHFTEKAWRQSIAPLDQLGVAAESLVEVAAPSVRRAASDTTKKQAQELVAATSHYRDAIKAFADAWHRQFAVIEKLDVDPFSATILEEFERIRSDLNGFLYDSGQDLASLRTRVRALGEDPSEDARHHVFLSDLTRAFQTVPAIHHRFVFAARKIETANNFRLDAAVRAARGLWRRTRDRIGLIEKKLLQEATQLAKQEQIENVAAAEKLLEELQTEMDRVVDSMMSLQEDLNLNADRSEAFSRAVVRMEVAANRLKLLRADMGRTERRQRRLSADRVAAADAFTFQFLSSEPVNGPENLQERLKIGGLTAVLTFVAAMFGQWWITRKTLGDAVHFRSLPAKSSSGRTNRRTGPLKGGTAAATTLSD